MRVETSAVLTVKQLHEQLKARGEAISYDSLSALLNAGDIAEQLRITGGGNARRIDPCVVDILAEFLPRYREARGRLPQAPEMLRAFLKGGSPSLQIKRGGDTRSPIGSTARSEALLPVRTNGSSAELSSLAELANLPAERWALLERYTSALEAHAAALASLPPPGDQLLDLAGVRDLVPMSAGWLRRNVPSVRLGRRRLWRKSEVLRFIAELPGINTDCSK